MPHIYREGQRVIATSTITSSIPCHNSHNATGNLLVWEVPAGAMGTAQGEAMNVSGKVYVPVTFGPGIVIWHDTDPEAQRNYLCILDCHIAPYPLSCPLTADESLSPLAEAQVAATEDYMLGQMQGRIRGRGCRGCEWRPVEV